MFRHARGTVARGALSSASAARVAWESSASAPSWIRIVKGPMVRWMVPHPQRSTRIESVWARRWRTTGQVPADMILIITFNSAKSSRAFLAPAAPARAASQWMALVNDPG